MDFDNMNIWCWLLPALVGIISGILGYLIGKGNTTSIDNTEALRGLERKNEKLNADLEECHNKVTAMAAVPKVLAIPFDAAAAKTAMGKTIKEDDLKVIEGIGPKISEMFQGAGIRTWRALSETSVASCQEVLNTGGERYKVHDPASWPMQAKMCYEGKWSDLAKWQDEHDHGKL